MSLAVDVSILNVAGDVIATIDAFDVSIGTGAMLRDAIAKATGFPAMKIKILHTIGAVIEMRDKLSAVFTSEDLGSGSLSVCCALDGFSVPLGPKIAIHDGPRRRRTMGSKAGFMCSRMLDGYDRAGKTSAWVYRAPDKAQRDEAERLIKCSFAEHLGALIEVAMDSAFRDRDADGTSCDKEEANYVFEDEAAKVYVDLSTCQVWTRYVPEGEGDDLRRRLTHIRINSGENMTEGDGGLLSAVVWRLLPSWKNLGPILEILFLATSPLLRESRSASNLATELEVMAASMGCSALAVAAVPDQGHSFWQSRGFEVHAPLKESPKRPPVEAADAEAAQHITSEAVFELDACTELGEFLMENMLLFTDCPLVAKELKEERHDCLEQSDPPPRIALS